MPAQRLDELADFTCRPIGDEAMINLNLRKRFDDLLLGPEHESDGQGLVEYALILFFVSLVAMAGLTALGVGVKTKLYDVIVAATPW